MLGKGCCTCGFEEGEGLVDVYLVIWEVHPCEQHVKFTGCEECMILYSVAIKIVGGTWFNL
jgi:hypothetical protein